MPNVEIVTDLSQALLFRTRPAVTRWNRLEGRPRTHDFDRALRAEVRDAVWMLARQWQMGEFQGNDAGSPILARACIDTSPIDRFQPGAGAVQPLDGSCPLEPVVERRALPLRAGEQYLSLDLRLLVGRRWMKMLARSAAEPGGLSADYRAQYLGQYRVAVPDPTDPADASVCAHAEAWQMARAAAGRAMDGIALLEHLADPANNAWDGIGAAALDEPKLAALAGELGAWFEMLFLQPSGQDDAWQSQRLEYQFGVSAPAFGPGAAQGDQLVMRAEEYFHGHLDWYSLEHAAGDRSLGENGGAAGAPERRTHTFIPTSIVFDGMPNTRWWAFEDRRTNFGAVRPDTTDLGTLLLMEFALVYANDWMVLPFTLPIGRVAEPKGIAISTVFDERIWIEPVRETPASQEWEQWTMFTLETSGSDDRAAPPPRLVLLPTAPKVQEGEPVEEVALIRDEMANMVWGVERRVPLSSGRSAPGGEAARDLHRYLQRLVGPVPEETDSVAPSRYRVMTTVPEHWIPFISVHVDGSARETQLQRAALPRILQGDPNPPVKVRPRTALLRQNLPRAYFVHEEEVPRAGALVRQSYQRARWTGGRVFVWLGARKLSGRGEGSSNLRFDALLDATR